MIKKLLRENLNLHSFITNWGDFIMDTTDYNINDMKSLYSDGLNSLNIKLRKHKYIYRGLSVNDNWLKLLRENKEISIGRFWSFNKSISTSFMNSSDVYDNEYKHFKGENKVFIIAKTPVNISTIDVDATIAHEIVSSEDELRLLKNSKLYILEIFVNGIKVDISNKTFIV